MTILQALNRYYDRMAARGDAVPPGYSLEPIGVVITLSEEGSIIDVGVTRDQTGKKPKPERVPKWFGRSGNGSTPYFLWDNTAYALGVSTKDPDKTSRDHAAFKELHLRVLADEQDPGLKAVRSFLEKWAPEQFVAPRFDGQMMTWNLAFRLDGDSNLIHERAAAREYIERLRTGEDVTPAAFCLVTGEKSSPVRLHPKIKGIAGTASAEVPLVSFNEDAFESYGKKQAFNAPTSEAAAFRYSAALNGLLDRTSSRNRLRLADTTVAFWADTSGVGENAANAAEDLFASIFNPPETKLDADYDAQESAKLRDKLEDFARGRPIKGIDPRLECGTRFYVLGLAPNTARLSVRLWLEDSFEEIARRLALHARDLEIEPRPRQWGRPPSIQRLLVKTTALREKFENIPPQLAGEVTRAVLTGLPYPRTLLSSAITRLRAGDDAGAGWHAAVIKACINRALRFGFSNGRARQDALAAGVLSEEELPVGLEPDKNDIAYQLGRLFAVLEAAQYAALGRVNAPIGDRYYAAASATPARVFGPLLRGLKHHVSDARRRGRGLWIEPKVGEIMLMLPPELPKTLRLEDQGRFAVGYYHERATRPAKSDDSESEREDNDE